MARRPAEDYILCIRLLQVLKQGGFPEAIGEMLDDNRLVGQGLDVYVNFHAGRVRHEKSGGRLNGLLVVGYVKYRRSMPPDCWKGLKMP